MQLVFVEEAFRTLKGDLAIRPVFHQKRERIEAHLFVAFLAYCLSITLRQQLRGLAGGLMPRAVLEKLATMQMLDVRVPTTDGRELLLVRRTEPGNDIAQTQLTAATHLRDKFTTALSGLDQRARLLVSFFNDCEARIAVLQSTKRDFEEIRKLDRLADGSDEIVTNAQETLISIGNSFVSEALRVANALGGLERAGLVNLAGGVSVDQLETLADRIVESAERDRTALEQVARTI